MKGFEKAARSELVDLLEFDWITLRYFEVILVGTDVLGPFSVKLF